MKRSKRKNKTKRQRRRVLSKMLPSSYHPFLKKENCPRCSCSYWYGHDNVIMIPGGSHIQNVDMLVTSTL
jgi:hypothetical protein